MQNKTRRTSHLTNIIQFDTAGNVVLPAILTLGAAPDAADDSLKVPSTAWVRALLANAGPSLNGTGFVRMAGTTVSYITGTSSQFVKADGSLDSNTYLTTANAASTYLSQASASSTYLTLSLASSTYLSQTDASNTYLTLTNAANTYLSQASASNIYLTLNNAANTYLTQASASSTYLTLTNAANTYLSQASASSTYLTLTNASSTYLTQTSAANTYVSLSGSYANPGWITSLAWSKITGAPAFLTAESDTLATVTGRGASTSSAVTFNGNVSVGTSASLSFGAQTRQMVNLWDTSYGLGVQSATLYFRSGSRFSWHRGGGHNDGENNPGGGTVAMTLDGSSNLAVTGSITSGGTAVVLNNGGTWGINITGNAASSTLVTHLSGRTDGTFYNVVWAAGSPSYLYSCDAIQIRSSDGRLKASSFESTGDIYFGTRGVWLSNYLNQAVLTSSTPSFTGLTLNGGTINGQSHFQFDGATFRNPGDWTASLLVRRDNGTTGLSGSIPALVLYNNNGGDQTTAAISFASAEGATGQGNAVALAGIIAKKESSGNIGGWSAGSLTLYVKDFATRRDAIFIGNDARIGLSTTDFSFTSSDNASVINTISNNRLFVNGSIQLLGNQDAIVFGRGAASFMRDEEIGFGWGGGFFMTDATFLRVRNGGSVQLYTPGIMRADGDMRAPIFYDQADTGFYLDPNGTSNLSQLTTSTRARWGKPRWWMSRASHTSDENYWTGTNGWGTDHGNWSNAWRGGFSGWDIWGSSTDHPQGGGYIHAQGIVSGQHFATSDGSQGYGWMMVGAHAATENRYWLRGKWGTSTSGWVEMITTGNIGSQSVNYANSAGRAFPRRADGTNMDFYWSGQNGQPTWLWGSNNGVDMYVWNPSNFSVNYANSAGSLSNMNISQFTNNSGYITSAADWFGAVTTGGTADWNHSSNTRPGTGFTLLLGNHPNGPGPGEYFHSFNLEYSSRTGGGNVTQFAISYGSPGNRMYMRGRYDGAWTGWLQFLHSGNFTNWAPTLTGGGASGTWGINITGSAASATNANMLWDAYRTGYRWSNDLHVSYAYNAGNADTVDGYHLNQGVSTSSSPSFSGVSCGSLDTGNYINIGYNRNGAESVATSAFRGIDFHNTGDFNYYIGKPAGAWTQPLHIHFYTGIRLRSHQSYGGTQFYNLSSSVTTATVNDGDNNFRGYYDVIAYASDRRLKEDIKPIENAVEKVMQLTGMTYKWNTVGQQYGWTPSEERESGVFAQDVQAVLPEAVRLAPFDEGHDGKGNKYSKSGQNFLTVKYEKLVPLLVEAIKEQQSQIEDLKQQLELLKN